MENTAQKHTHTQLKIGKPQTFRNRLTMIEVLK